MASRDFARPQDLPIPSYYYFSQAAVNFAVALGFFWAAHAINSVAERIFETTGEQFVPSEPIFRFKWFWYFGKPWISLALGFVVGTLWGFIEYSQFHRNKSAWIEGSVDRARGTRTRGDWKDFRRALKVLTLVVIAPALLLTLLLHMSGIIYAFSVGAAMSFVTHPIRRELDTETDRVLSTSATSESDAHLIESWRQRRSRLLRHSLIADAAFIVAIVITTILFSNYVHDTFSTLEHTIAERDHGAVP